MNINNQDKYFKNKYLKYKTKYIQLTQLQNQLQNIKTKLPSMNRKQIMNKIKEVINFRDKSKQKQAILQLVKKNGNAKKFIQFTENIDRKTLNAKADLICTDFKNVIDFINNDI